MSLEQGRDISPSDSVLDSVSGALPLSPGQRSQLYLPVRGRHGDAYDQARAAQVNVEGLRRALAVPEIVVGRGAEVGASNALHEGAATDEPRRAAAT